LDRRRDNNASDAGAERPSYAHFRLDDLGLETDASG
jgi:hypothetical protein